MKKEKRNYNTLLALIVLILLIAIVVLVLNSVMTYYINLGGDTGGITASSAIAESSGTCGAPTACEWRDEVTLNNNLTRKGCVKYPKIAGTACTDACVSDGICTAFDEMDPSTDGYSSKSLVGSFCNATSLDACRGTCTTFDDCALPPMIFGLDTNTIAMCYSGQCLFQTLISADGDIYIPQTLFIPTFPVADTVAMGPESAVCKWALLDNTHADPTPKNCFDVGYQSENIFPFEVTCHYMYKCSRPNFNGRAGTIVITKKRQDGHPSTISVPHPIMRFYENVTHPRHLGNVTRSVFAYLKNHPAEKAEVTRSYRRWRNPEGTNQRDSQDEEETSETKASTESNPLSSAPPHAKNPPSSSNNPRRRHRTV